MIPRHQALKAISRSDIYMKEHLVYRVISIIVILCVYKNSVRAIAISQMCCSFLLAVFVMITSCRYNDYKFREQFADLAHSFFGCVIMGVPVYCIKFLHFSNTITFAIQITIGVIIYVLYSHCAKNDEYKYCKELVYGLITKINHAGKVKKK